MTKNEIITQFKNELRNYKYTSYMLNSLLEKESDIWYELEGVKAISYDRLPSNYNIQLIEEKKLFLMERLKTVKEQIDRLQTQIRYVDKILSNMKDTETRDALINIYINKKSLKYEADKIYITDSGLLKRIDKCIYEAVEKTIDEM